jgi:hypothetical protein
MYLMFAVVLIFSQVRDAGSSNDSLLLFGRRGVNSPRRLPRTGSWRMGRIRDTATLSISSGHGTALVP